MSTGKREKTTMFASLRRGDKFKSPLLRASSTETPVWVKMCRGWAKDERGFCVAMLEMETIVSAD